MNNKRSEFFKKMPDRVYDEYPNIREFVNSSSMVDIYREENASTHRLVSILFCILLLPL